MDPKEDDKKVDDPIIEDEDLDLDDDLDTEDDLEIDLDDDDEKAAREAKDRNKAFASMRIENKDLKTSVDTLTQTVSDLQQRTSALAPTQALVPDGVPRTDEEWDALAEKDWKKAVDLRSTENARVIMSNQQESARADSTLLDAKQKVLAAHPELNDNASEKSKVYLSILDQNPDYLRQPKGPLYAMRDMEDYMENTLGYRRDEIRSAEKKGAQREAGRQNRIVLNKGAGRAGIATGNKVVITKDEMEFCKFQGIDPKEYAKNKQKLSKSGSKEGVSV